jgi:hypothetical protein
MVACTGDYLASGIESTLSSMIIGMWTTFETLAGDLWEATVNCHPHGLSLLAGKRKNPGQNQMGDDQQPKAGQEMKKDAGRMIQFSRLFRG